MCTERKQQRAQEVLQVIMAQASACELKWSLFYSAVNGNPSAIKPCPPEFLDQSTNDLQLELLQATARQVPAFEQLPAAAESLPENVIDLLHWTLVQCKDPQFKLIVPANYPAPLQRSLTTKPPSQWPQYVFEVLPNTESNAEKKFQQHKAQYSPDSASFAFHGSKLESFFSILNFGLAQHLCKRDLYGDGAYLSTAMDVAMNFSGQGTSWPNSHLFGDHYSCLAYCEYVPNPMHIRSDPKKIPKSYIVLTNNEIVRVRYVLVFTKAPKRRWRTGDSPNTVTEWSSGAKITIGVILYLCLLGFVGIYNRGNFIKDAWSLWE